MIKRGYTCTKNLDLITEVKVGNLLYFIHERGTRKTYTVFTKEGRFDFTTYGGFKKFADTIGRNNKK